VAARHDVQLSVDAEEFLSYLLVERGRSKNSITSYHHDLVSYEEFLHAKDLTLSNVKSADIDNYLGFLRAAGLAPSSQARALAAIRGLHQFCLEERNMSIDPTVDVEAPHIPTAIPKALSEQEVMRLLDAVAGDDTRALRDQAMLEVLYATGLRISELVNLSIGDVDASTALLRAFGKGSKERIVPIGRHALAALARWYGPGGRTAYVPKQWAHRGDAEAIFLSSRGRRMNRQGAWVVVRMAAERSDLADRVSPHVLRHSFATHLLDHGADVRVVQELLGHASITTTQIYTKVSQEHLKRAYLNAHPRARHRPNST
jgi:integrase/recombinase XerD